MIVQSLKGRTLQRLRMGKSHGLSWHMENSEATWNLAVQVKNYRHGHEVSAWLGIPCSVLISRQSGHREV